MSSPMNLFHPGRDIRRWMRDRTSNAGLGRLNSINHLKVLCGDDSAALGAAKLLDNIYPELLHQSRSTNDMWEVCPFAFGAGLLEALATAYSIGLHLSDDTQR